MRTFAIAGLPGAGKTTLAAALAQELDAYLISTGDIARRVDPLSLSHGLMADSGVFAAAFQEELSHVPRETKFLVLDGIPRTRQQLDILPDGAEVIALNCRTDVCIERLGKRARKDDTPELVARRIQDQWVLLDLGNPEGWYRRLNWRTQLNTATRTPAAILAGVLAYINGQKKEVF